LNGQMTFNAFSVLGNMSINSGSYQDEKYYHKNIKQNKFKMILLN